MQWQESSQESFRKNETIETGKCPVRLRRPSYAPVGQILMNKIQTCLQMIIPALFASTLGACMSLDVAPVSAQATVDKVISLQESQQWLQWYSDNGQWSNRLAKWNGKQDITEVLRNDFDVADILKVLPNLSMQSGKIMDYVYHLDTPALCGCPVLYARSKGDTHFESYASLSNSMPEAEAKGRITNMWSKGHGYFLDSIRTDGSKDGFFQLVILYVMGDQFFKFFHDWYHDELIICDKSGLDALFKKHDDKKDSSKYIPDEVRRSAYSLQLAPTVKYKGDTVIVSVVMFTDWGGFQRHTFTIRRYPPHSVVKQEMTTLIEYYCGILI